MSLANDLIYQIALTLVPHLGPVRIRFLLDHYTPQEIFKARKSELEKLDSIGSYVAHCIKNFNNYKEAEQEALFIDKFKITPLFINHPDYPKRLHNCYDPPAMLYYKGTANLNAAKIVSVVGTRSNTTYGQQLTEQFITDLASENIIVVSGMAYGIDVTAHKAAVKNNLATIGVLAHGLNQIYPNQHSTLAKNIISENGGLLTEFRSSSKPDKHNFPARNRIVAGMSDATVVIETAIKGGSMITAELANGYNRDVYAFPGRTDDSFSAGCNYLIKQNKAVLLTNARELLTTMGWIPINKTTPRPQKSLFIDLSANEKSIVSLLQEKEMANIDELNIYCNISSSSIAAAILNLEMQNVIVSLPGKYYKLT